MLTRWELPYHFRLASTLRTYVLLPEIDRDSIAAAKEDGVWWRGETVTEKDGGPGQFIRVYQEILRMKQAGGAKAYLALPEVREMLDKPIGGHAWHKTL